MNGSFLIKYAMTTCSSITEYWGFTVHILSGEQFMVGPEICGARLSVRYNEGILSLWNKNASKKDMCYRFGNVYYLCFPLINEVIFWLSNSPSSSHS